MSEKNLLTKVWIPITIIMNSISLINLQKDIFPALVKWKDLINLVLDYYSNFVEYIFYPIYSTFSYVFHIDIPSWVAHYVITLLILLNSLTLTLKYIKHKDTPYFYIITFLVFFWWIVFPILILTMIVNIVIHIRPLTLGEKIYFNYIISTILLILSIIIINNIFL